MLILMKKHDPLPILVNAENWSEESRRSLKYISAPIEYRDIQFTCYRCRTAAVYSAAEQRESFLGFFKKEQRLDKYNGDSYDVLQAESASGKKQKFVFNVSVLNVDQK